MTETAEKFLSWLEDFTTTKIVVHMVIHYETHGIRREFEGSDVYLFYKARPDSKVYCISLTTFAGYPQTAHTDPCVHQFSPEECERHVCRWIRERRETWIDLEQVATMACTDNAFITETSPGSLFRDELTLVLGILSEHVRLRETNGDIPDADKLLSGLSGLRRALRKTYTKKVEAARELFNTFQNQL